MSMQNGSLTGSPRRPLTVIWFAKTSCASTRAVPVPTYVVEFLLGRYCASVDGERDQRRSADRREAVEGSDGAHRRGGTVQGAAKETGSVKLIDIVRPGSTGRRLLPAELPSLAGPAANVRSKGPDGPRQRTMLTDGFYRSHAELRRRHCPADGGRPFKWTLCGRSKCRKSDVLDVAHEGAQTFSVTMDRFPAGSIGLGSIGDFDRARRCLLRSALRERNYNMVELGPRGTGRATLFQQISAVLAPISRGKATVAKMLSTTRRAAGLVCQYDVVFSTRCRASRSIREDGVTNNEGLHGGRAISAAQGEHPCRRQPVMVGNWTWMSSSSRGSDIC